MILEILNDYMTLWMRAPSDGSDDDIRDALQALQSSPFRSMGDWYIRLIDAEIDEGGNVIGPIEVVWNRAID